MKFDYDVIAHCQYELLDSHNNPFDCGEPASYRVWWDTFGKDMKVCKKHFEYIKKCEESNSIERIEL